ncbi:hypothetical protein DSM112329_03637 [Paraconexibacter sp. AEG42_29]|uniref:Uncharacterized protein n=1 Tax=Paraconexibacter sp. AEG42_29 TaxID=2997339 RepID=A0AAU7AYD7_9ACTN
MDTNAGRNDQPPRPRRGTDVAEARPDREREGRRSTDTAWPRGAATLADPRVVLAMADGHPAGIKQFLQFCLVLVYPAFLFLVVVAWPLWAVGKVLEWVLVFLFWPLRAYLGRREEASSAGAGAGH